MTVGVGILQGVVLLRIRGSLDFARDDGTRSVVFYKDGRPFQGILRVFSNPLNDKITFEMMTRGMRDKVASFFVS